MGDEATSPPKARPFRNFLKLVPVLEWFYPIDHRRLWKDAYNEAYPSGKTLKESYKDVWEMNTLAAVLVLAMNAGGGVYPGGITTTTWGLKQSIAVYKRGSRVPPVH